MRRKLKLYYHVFRIYTAFRLLHCVIVFTNHRENQVGTSLSVLLWLVVDVEANGDERNVHEKEEKNLKCANPQKTEFFNVSNEMIENIISDFMMMLMIPIHPIHSHSFT